MIRDALIVRSQRALLVEKEGAQRLAYWFEYAIGSRTRTLLIVVKPTRLLLPRFGAGLFGEEHVYELPADGVRTWLEAHGYRVLPD